MKPKTKSELMAEWANQPGQLKKEREVKAIRKAMDDARAVMQDGLNRYVKKKTKARSMAKAEADPFAELEGWESMEQIRTPTAMARSPPTGGTSSPTCGKPGKPPETAARARTSTTTL